MRELLLMSLTDPKKVHDTELYDMRNKAKLKLDALESLVAFHAQKTTEGQDEVNISCQGPSGPVALIIERMHLQVVIQHEIVEVLAYIHSIDQRIKVMTT